MDTCTKTKSSSKPSPSKGCRSQKIWCLKIPHPQTPPTIQNRRRNRIHPTDTLDTLQQELDQFQHHYNTIRPHRGIGRNTPQFAYNLIPKATPKHPNDPNIWQVRYDIVDQSGTITLRFAGDLKHLGIGRKHARTEVICLVHNTEATVLTHTGEVLAEFTIDPTKNYQTKNA